MSVKLWSRSFDLFLVVLGLAALLCLSPLGTALAMIAAIAVIGLPITLAMAAIPTLFLVLLTARLIYLALLAFGLRAKILSAVLALGILAIVPWQENRRLDAIADSVIDGDMNRLAGPPSIETLAVVTPKAYHATGICDDFCQRTLLNKVVGSLIMVKQETPLAEPADDVSGTMYRLEKRSICPPIDLKDGVGNLEIPGEKREWGDKTPADLLRLKAAEGLCLIAEKAPIANADAVLVRGPVRRGMSPDTAGFSPVADTVSADRLSFYVRDNGALVERYRSTGVTYYRLLPILAPSYASSSGMGLKPGLLRRAAYRGGARQYDPAPPLEPFLSDVLGFDLVLRGGDAKQATTRLIAAALDRPGLVDRASAKVMSDFFEDIHRRKDVMEDDARLALRILKDRRVPVPRLASAPVRKFATADGALTPQFAEALFDRLSDAKPGEREDDPDYLGYTLDYLGDAIAALPDEAIRPYRAALEKLARDREARVEAYSALTRLSVFGADGVPTLIYLIDDAASRKVKNKAGNEWQHPYLAGLIGLCRTGPAGNAAIPMIYDRLASGVMVKFGSYRDLTINTLVHLGAGAEDIWAHMETGDRNHTRERLDRQVQRAGTKVDCSY
ncbi:hypothetical protein ACG873_21985 [Mesorhizobium sp. AaZ16]|uniref:hypothetical protein n=1 Tax=Mesorhizobium sp. AaZ16 TaxID=3402289 RepID=UPI00374F711F